MPKEIPLKIYIWVWWDRIKSHCRKIWRVFTFDRIRRTYRASKFRSKNYPVCIVPFPKGFRVLVRNLDTHKYGGWYLSMKRAIQIWGWDVVEMLKGNPKSSGKFV